MMKLKTLRKRIDRIALYLFFISAFAVPAGAQSAPSAPSTPAKATKPAVVAPTYSAILGVNFFAYEHTALETGIGVLIPLQEGLGMEMKAAYAVQPSADAVFMAIPVQAGLRFSFGSDPAGFHTSIGLEPVFTLSPNSFRMGPYLGLEGSLRVHPFLVLFAGLEQALLFGGPTNLVSTGTRLHAGLRFALGK